MAEKQAHEGVQYKKPKKSQEDHQMWDNPKERYPQDQSKRVYTEPSRIWKNDIVLCNNSLSQSRLYLYSRPSRRSPLSQPHHISTISRQAYVSKL